MTTPIQFHISAPEPDQHIYRIEMNVRDIEGRAHLDLALPAWTPGSYLIREYAQHVQRLEAFGPDGRPLRVRKEEKALWRIDCEGADEVRIGYEVFGHDLNVRYNHLDCSHGFVHPPAAFMHPVGELDRPVELHVAAPEGWSIFTALRRATPEQTWFVAEDFDHLYDSPIEMGPHAPIDFEAAGVAHRMVFWGRGNYDPELLARDVPKIVEANASFFGGEVPYDDFLFVTLLTDGAGGGLEHRDSTILMFPRHDFRAPDGDPSELPISDEKYLDFLSLVAHEHFHVWNVKRIRPEVLGPFDYARENYTRELWTVEGVTSYYQTVALRRAGLVSPQKFLDIYADAIRALETIPGRLLQSLEDASFDAWIRLYRPHENNLNSTVSYYLKGLLVVLLLDLHLRVESDGEFGFDDVLRHLWEHFAGERGFPEGQFQAIVEEVTGVEVGPFFDAFVRGVDEPDWEARLAPMGLKLERGWKSERPKAWPGLKLNGSGKVAPIAAGTPAAAAGIYAGDELVALDGWKIDGQEGLDRLLADYAPDQTVTVHLFRRGELLERQVTLARTPPDDYKLTPRDDAAPDARRLLADWLEADEAAIFEGDDHAANH